MRAALSKLYRNTLFRLSLLGAVFFVVALMIALGNIYFLTISSEIRQVDRSLADEVKEFQTLLDEGGLIPLSREIFLRSGSGDRHYLLTSRNQNGDDMVMGSLGEQIVTLKNQEKTSLGQESGSGFTKVDFILVIPATDTQPAKERRMRGLSGYLQIEGRNIAAVVASRDVEVTMRTAERVKSAIWISSAIALVLGLISSWYVSRKFTQRVEAFNRLATDVRAGHLERRAPRNYSEDEMDLLAEHLNDMLDHIDRLMKAMRYAGDSIAHDLRSPLTRLRTRLETAATEVKDPKAEETLFAAAGDADELLKTFDSVLRIARLEAGERREMLSELDPKPLLDDIAELYEPACEDTGRSFSSDIDAGLTILADRGLMSQAVSNLVENAIKYTPEGGAIHLSLKKNKEGRTEISIIDNGPGIPEDSRQRVKERFVRLDESRSKPGSGLGLALVDAIADLHRATFVLDAGMSSADDTRPGLAARLIFPRTRKQKQISPPPDNPDGSS